MSFAHSSSCSWILRIEELWQNRTTGQVSCAYYIPAVAAIKILSLLFFDYDIVLYLLSPSDVVPPFVFSRPAHFFSCSSMISVCSSSCLKSQGPENETREVLGFRILQVSVRLCVCCSSLPMFEPLKPELLVCKPL